MKTILSTLSEEGIERLVCIPPILAGANLENGSHLSHEEDTRALKLEIDHLKRKLHHKRRKQTPSNSDFSFDDKENGSYRHRSRTPPSESFSYVEDYYHECRNRNSSSKGLGMMQWVEHSTKFPNHHSRAKLREGDFLGSSPSPRSPCIMVEQILWSMWAISTREWLCTPRMRPWCARCSLPV